MSQLADPQRDEDLFDNPKYSVMVAVCTHLGCVPVPNEGLWKAYFCPCHGSHFDHAGRIRKGPAPTNLEIPPHKHVSAKTLYLGDPASL
eukprot:NODE_1220_length_1046_cov_182.402207_g938_i0.p4 GENE.NODE_1220_length_1046_cov_182.402207_g938_i0~~NODE_1220_length_1046_cov_182.402207_g938_i0.p4  ORF type:complete len:89 (+),score=15.20 NODE_1220_length_1046_cov_182.402207_g938_i0:694-960(+)